VGRDRNGAEGVEMSEYRKFCYWVDLAGMNAVREHFRTKEIELPDEARIPCRVLRPSLEAAFLAPPAWDGFCKRRTSWYRKSPKARNFLVVSNSRLLLPVLEDPIVIAESDFRPDRFPSPEEMSQLIRSGEYQRRKPREWDKPESSEREFYQRWFERKHGGEPFDFEKMLISHSANHANFIDPVYFVSLNGNKVPYSLGDSFHVCSSCLEFFNILGDPWPLKYVVPCIGAVQFARLPADRYFEVRISQGD
jgi:hypothetical protein